MPHSCPIIVKDCYDSPFHIHIRNSARRLLNLLKTNVTSVSITPETHWESKFLPVISNMIYKIL